MKKKKIITSKINKTKLFKRFLKENGIFAYYKRAVDKNIKIKTFFNSTKPIDYITEAPTQNELDKIALQAYNPQWKLTCNIGFNKEEIINQFILFLKKRNLYDTYINEFNTEYTRSIVLHEQDMIQRGWRRNGVEPLIDQEFKTWENLNPELYIEYTPLIKHTHEKCTMWQTVNERWKEHLAKISNN